MIKEREKQIKVTLVVPVYNVADYIKRCLNSIILQTYTGPLECILVDDCGKDNSVSIAKKIIEEYKGQFSFRILHHEHNRGLSAARNTGLKAATGDYIYYLDSDDELPQNAIELMADEVAMHPGVDMVQGFTQSVPMTDYYDTSCFKNNQYVTENTWIRKHFYQIGKTIPVNGVNKLINIEFLRRNNLYFKEGIIHEDEHWMFYLVKYLSSMAFVFEPTYIRYFNEGSIMQSMTTDREGKSWGLIISEWLDNCDAISIDAQVKKCLMRYAKHQVYLYWGGKSDSRFIKKIYKTLCQERKWISIIYLTAWLTMRPVKNVRKLLRKTLENI